MHATVVALCLVGLAVAAYMERKSRLGAAGQLAEFSVVQTPRAKLLGSASNSLVGIIFYAALLIASFFFDSSVVLVVAFVAALGAAAMSGYLAYSLLFVTRLACVFCWVGHLVNWALAIVIGLSVRGLF
ncbi:MAG: hypothetical protein M3T49_09360 [Candidatus Eremiobacteraeota bacterium]|nr:hypothetical protein [Candidatus Eremiobacteraeota bacterium]